MLPQTIGDFSETTMPVKIIQDLLLQMLGTVSEMSESLIGRGRKISELSDEDREISDSSDERNTGTQQNEDDEMKENEAERKDDEELREETEKEVDDTKVEKESSEKIELEMKMEVDENQESNARVEKEVIDNQESIARVEKEVIDNQESNSKVDKEIVEKQESNFEKEIIEDQTSNSQVEAEPENSEEIESTENSTKVDEMITDEELLDQTSSDQNPTEIDNSDAQIESMDTITETPEPVEEVPIKPTKEADSDPVLDETKEIGEEEPSSGLELETKTSEVFNKAVPEEVQQKSCLPQKSHLQEESSDLNQDTTTNDSNSDPKVDVEGQDRTLENPEDTTDPIKEVDSVPTDESLVSNDLHVEKDVSEVVGNVSTVGDAVEHIPQESCSDLAQAGKTDQSEPKDENADASEIGLADNEMVKVEEQEKVDGKPEGTPETNNDSVHMETDVNQEHAPNVDNTEANTDSLGFGPKVLNMDTSETDIKDKDTVVEDEKPEDHNELIQKTFTDQVSTDVTPANIKPIDSQEPVVDKVDVSATDVKEIVNIDKLVDTREEDKEAGLLHTDLDMNKMPTGNEANTEEYDTKVENMETDEVEDKHNQENEKPEEAIDETVASMKENIATKESDPIVGKVHEADVKDESEVEESALPAEPIQEKDPVDVDSEKKEEVSTSETETVHLESDDQKEVIQNGEPTTDASEEGATSKEAVGLEVTDEKSTFNSDKESVHCHVSNSKDESMETDTDPKGFVQEEAREEKGQDATELSEEAHVEAEVVENEADSEITPTKEIEPKENIQKVQNLPAVASSTLQTTETPNQMESESHESDPMDTCVETEPGVASAPEAHEPEVRIIEEEKVVDNIDSAKETKSTPVCSQTDLADKQESVSIIEPETSIPEHSGTHERKAEEQEEVTQNSVEHTSEEVSNENDIENTNEPKSVPNVVSMDIDLESEPKDFNQSAPEAESEPKDLNESAPEAEQQEMTNNVEDTVEPALQAASNQVESGMEVKMSCSKAEPEELQASKDTSVLENKEPTSVPNIDTESVSAEESLNNKSAPVINIEEPASPNVEPELVILGKLENSVQVSTPNSEPEAMDTEEPLSSKDSTPNIEPVITEESQNNGTLVLEAKATAPESVTTTELYNGPNPLFLEAIELAPRKASGPVEEPEPAVSEKVHTNSATTMDTQESTEECISGGEPNEMHNNDNSGINVEEPVSKQEPTPSVEQEHIISKEPSVQEAREPSNQASTPSVELEPVIPEELQDTKEHSDMKAKEPTPNEPVISEELQNECASAMETEEQISNQEPASNAEPEPIIPEELHRNDTSVLEAKEPSSDQEPSPNEEPEVSFSEELKNTNDALAVEAKEPASTPNVEPEDDSTSVMETEEPISNPESAPNVEPEPVISGELQNKCIPVMETQETSKTGTDEVVEDHGPEIRMDTEALPEEKHHENVFEVKDGAKETEEVISQEAMLEKSTSVLEKGQEEEPAKQPEDRDMEIIPSATEDITEKVELRTEVVDDNLVPSIQDVKEVKVDQEELKVESLESTESQVIGDEVIPKAESLDSSDNVLEESSCNEVKEESANNQEVIPEADEPDIIAPPEPVVKMDNQEVIPEAEGVKMDIDLVVKDDETHDTLTAELPDSEPSPETSTGDSTAVSEQEIKIENGESTSAVEESSKVQPALEKSVEKINGIHEDVIEEVEECKMEVMNEDREEKMVTEEKREEVIAEERISEVHEDKSRMNNMIETVVSEVVEGVCSAQEMKVFEHDATNEVKVQEESEKMVKPEILVPTDMTTTMDMPEDTMDTTAKTVVTTKMTVDSADMSVTPSGKSMTTSDMPMDLEAADLKPEIMSEAENEVRSGGKVEAVEFEAVLPRELPETKCAITEENVEEESIEMTDEMFMQKILMSLLAKVVCPTEFTIPSQESPPIESQKCESQLSQQEAPLKCESQLSQDDDVIIVPVSRDSSVDTVNDPLATTDVSEGELVTTDATTDGSEAELTTDEILPTGDEKDGTDSSLAADSCSEEEANEKVTEEDSKVVETEEIEIVSGSKKPTEKEAEVITVEDDDEPAPNAAPETPLMTLRFQTEDIPLENEASAEEASTEDPLQTSTNDSTEGTPDDTSKTANVIDELEPGEIVDDNQVPVTENPEFITSDTPVLDDEIGLEPSDLSAPPQNQNKSIEVIDLSSDEDDTPAPHVIKITSRKRKPTTTMPVPIMPPLKKVFIAQDPNANTRSTKKRKHPSTMEALQASFQKTQGKAIRLEEEPQPVADSGADQYFTCFCGQVYSDRRLLNLHIRLTHKDYVKSKGKRGGGQQPILLPNQPIPPNQLNMGMPTIANVYGHANIPNNMGTLPTTNPHAPLNVTNHMNPNLTKYVNKRQRKSQRIVLGKNKTIDAIAEHERRKASGELRKAIQCHVCKLMIPMQSLFRHMTEAHSGFSSEVTSPHASPTASPTVSPSGSGRSEPTSSPTSSPDPSPRRGRSLVSVLNESWANAQNEDDDEIVVID